MSSNTAPEYNVNDRNPLIQEVPNPSYIPPQAAGGRHANRPPVDFNPPKFAVTHPVSNDTTYEKLMNGLGDFFGFFGQIPCCFCCPNPFKEVDQGKIALVSRFGRYYKTGDPGLVSVNPLTEKIKYVNTTIRVTTLGPLPIVTQDNVSVAIEAVVYWHVTDPYLSTYGVSDVEKALVERTQTTLRAVLGGRDLQDLIENRDTIASAITDIIDKPARDWGVTVESILIKDIHLSRELQESLSSAATQKRIGESKVIQAQAEVDAAQLMREAAEILNTPAAMQIRTLDSLVMMAKQAGTKVLFVPVNQDYSNGSINAFGGAGATVGVNTIGGGGPMSPDGRQAALPYKLPGEKNSEASGSIPISQAVKDSAVYSQIMDM